MGAPPSVFSKRSIFLVGLLVCLAACASAEELRQKREARLERTYERARAKPTSAELAACLHARDRAICYLQIANRAYPSPFTRNEEYSRRPDIVRLIEGEQPDPALDRAPVLRDEARNQAMEAAKLEALRLDAEGASPRRSIAPIKSAISDLPGIDILAMGGQFEFSTERELRVSAYEDIVSRYFRDHFVDEGERPSRALVQLALSEWESDVRGNHNFTFGSVDSSRGRLAEDYVQFGDRDGARRVLARTGLARTEVAVRISLLAEEYDDAWRQLSADLTRSPAGPISDATRMQVSMTISGAEAAGQSDLVSKISEFLAQPDRFNIVDERLAARILPHLGNEAQGRILASIRARDDVDLWQYSRLLDAAGLTDALEQLISQLVVAGETDCPKGTRCEVDPLTKILATEGRIAELPSLRGFMDGVAYLNAHDGVVSTEISWGRGFPASLNWVEERDRRSGLTNYWLDFLRCANERASPSPTLMQTMPPEFDVAFECARKAIEAARLPANIEAWETRHRRFEDERAEPMTYVPTLGRYSVAETALEVARQANRYGLYPEEAQQLEDEALRLYGEAPPRRIQFDAAVALREIAELMLREDGRFVTRSAARWPLDWPK